MDPLAPLPPDPYNALGVPRDCDQSVIKSKYRKLVLQCHPDKVADVSLKKQKEEEFHKIQAAWELIGDERKRSEYDGLVTKQRIAREGFAKGGGHSTRGVNTRYDVRTQAPAGAGYRTTTATPQYEEHKPTSRSYDDHYDERSRKYDTYDPFPKHTSSRSPREKETVKVRMSSDRTRSDHKKSRDREERNERHKKFVHVESDSDEYQRFEQNYAKRSDEERRRKEDDDIRRKAAQARDKAEERRRSYDDTHPHERKMEEAVRYIDSRSRRDRTDTVRRSSARPSKDRPSSSGRERDRRGPKIVEWGDEERPIPSFKHSSSSPPEIHVPRMASQRSYTDSSRDHRRVETSPSPPSFRHAETMPSVSSSSRRKEATLPRPSGSNSPGSYPTIPSPKSSKYYYSPEGGVRLSPDDVGQGRRTIVVEPERYRHRSPSPLSRAPLSRPPMGANRPVETYTTAAPNHKIVTPPTLGRSQTFSGNDGRLYGEMDSDYIRRRQATYDKVSFAAKIGPEDIRWAPRGRDAPTVC